MPLDQFKKLKFSLLIKIKRMAPIIGSKSVASINRSHMLCTKSARIQQCLNGTFNPSCEEVFLRPHLEEGGGGLS